MKNQKGFSLTELIVFAGLILMLVIFGVIMLNQERARTRDARRMADITQIRFAFELLFNEKNSYAEAATGCPQKGSLVSTCALSQYLPEIGKISDPGKYSYKISEVPSEQNFGVTFTLEKGYYSLNKGFHTLSAEGIE